jgi:hypothetical protein
MRPKGVLHPLVARTARVKLGDVEGTQPVMGGATASRIVLDLQPGRAPLQSWLDAGDGTSRGAYFVDVKRLDE